MNEVKNFSILLKLKKVINEYDNKGLNEWDLINKIHDIIMSDSPNSETQKYVNQIIVTYFELRDLIKPYEEGNVDEEVCNKFAEMDELCHHGDPLDKYDPWG